LGLTQPNVFNNNIKILKYKKIKKKEKKISNFSKGILKIFRGPLACFFNNFV
jgi:hypothetical protein